MISNAYAQSPGVTGSNPMLQFALPVILIVVFYLLLVRPQQKRQKEQRALIEAVKSGDEVIAAGGVLGKVTKVGDQYLTLEIAQAGNVAVEIMVQKGAVVSVLPKGTLKSI